EPIAMGRQTIWGGAGKPPSRDVMLAAGRAARTEMLARVREGKGAARSGGRGPAPAGRSIGGGRNNTAGKAGGYGGGNGGEARNMNPDDGNFGGQDGAQPRSHLSAAEQAVRGPGQRPARGYGGGNGGGYGGPVAAGPSRAGAGGQPDPMRTSVDMMADRTPRRNNFGGNRNTGAPGSGGAGMGGGAGFGGGPSRSGGGNRSGSRGRSGGPGGSRGPGSRG
ncbi:MAG: RNA helicase, partial [Rhodoferax sp.]|nr:RNA helicase [Rhodoferax sp.]